MRIAILGDVHSNLPALRRVIDAARRESIDHWVQVGDVVGYGAEPRECIDLLRSLGATVCIGNHDAAVLGMLDASYFNHYARVAIDWTRSQLRTQDIQYLKSLPFVVEHHEYTLTHGTLRMPEQFGYVLTVVEAKESLRRQKTRMGFVGHSHVPAVYLERTDHADLDAMYAPELETSTEHCHKVLMNVGSVGQPRDEDPRAAFAIYDTDRQRIWIRRVEYDIAAAQRTILAAGLPDVLARRLDLGV
ncbi:MAG: metallophosphoesterase family protein [Planctomycetes bacterium]|nr:metallophosphoesterase family protein [Planctomycetota bacterium]